VEITVMRADYHDPEHQRVIPELLNAYASDLMGGGQPLENWVKQNLVAHLASIDHAFTFLAFADNAAVGLTNCFEGFSTFFCKPLINIHDFFVLKSYRSMGIGSKMLAKVEDYARERDCCKLTLEVLENNVNAIQLYKKQGFMGYSLRPETGTALFLEKKL